MLLCSAVTLQPSAIDRARNKTYAKGNVSRIRQNSSFVRKKNQAWSAATLTAFCVVFVA
jgi:hypothetical protein